MYRSTDVLKYVRVLGTKIADFMQVVQCNSILYMTQFLSVVWVVI